MRNASLFYQGSIAPRHIGIANYVSPGPMNTRPLLILLSASVLCFSASAAEDAPKKQATKEEIKARLAEHARKKEKSVPAPAPAAMTTAPTPTAAPVTTSKDKAAPATTSAKDEKAAPPAKEAAAVLPKVDVRKDRITELDRQVEKQNQEIAREKKNTKPTPLDETLNSPKLSKALALFGGQSSDDRSNVAKERVAMMEEERDMIEAIDQARTKEEKEELQKTLDSMRAMRREFEQALR
jgi:hypothetical protein